MAEFLIFSYGSRGEVLRVTGPVVFSYAVTELVVHCGGEGKAEMTGRREMRAGGRRRILKRKSVRLVAVRGDMGV